MTSPNPLKALARILKDGLENGDPKQPIRNVLAKSMGVKPSVQQLTDFYLLVNEAYKLAVDLQKITGQDDAMEAIEDLRTLLFKYHTWATAWEGLAAQLKNGRHAIILNTIGSIYELTFTTKSLDNKFLNNLLDVFSSVEAEVLESDISNALRAVILRHIKEIKLSIKHYDLYGNQGLTSALSNSLGSIISDPSTRKEAANKPLVRRFFSVVAIASQAVFTSIGVVADVDGYLVPKLEDVLNQEKPAEHLYVSLDEISNILDQYMEFIHQKSLPPASYTEESPVSNDNGDE